MRAKFSKQFLKAYNKSSKKIQAKVDFALDIFYQNSQDIQLRNHLLTGKYLGHRSIDITGDFRAIYRETEDNDGKFAYFIALGTHSQLYG